MIWKLRVITLNLYIRIPLGLIPTTVYSFLNRLNLTEMVVSNSKCSSSIECQSHIGGGCSISDELLFFGD